jgi:hypothetical protein
MNNKSPLSEDEVSLVETNPDIANPNRRDVLHKLGGFAAYTAPTMLMLLTPRSGHSGSLNPGDLPPPPGGGGLTGF